MIFVALFLSLVFFSLGFIITPSNAKYLLSGYNTMPEKERAQIDIVSYLRWFKKFHIFLGVSLLLGTILISYFNTNWASIFMTSYPILAYIYMILGKKDFIKTKSQRLTSYWTAGLLIFVAGLIFVMSFKDYKSSDIVFDEKKLSIEGSFGMDIKKEDILNQELVDKLPESNGPFSKAYGFAGGDYAKGTFRIKEGGTVKLYVNKKVTPILFLQTKDQKIYYNSDSEDMNELNQKILDWRSH